MTVPRTLSISPFLAADAPCERRERLPAGEETRSGAPPPPQGAPARTHHEAAFVGLLAALLLAGTVAGVAAIAAVMVLP